MKDQKMFHVETDKGHAFDIGSAELSELTILHKSGNSLKVCYKDKIMHVEIMKSDHVNKTYQLQIDGKIIHYRLETHLDVLIREMGMEKSGSLKIDQTVSPMPGLVLNVLVEEREQLNEGAPMLILEAMKMENVIKAPADVQVDKILVKKGDSVDKHSVLITFT